jgi:predicted nucleotidyltransferase
LIEVARPKKIILFGSYVRGDATRDSARIVLRLELTGGRRLG